MPRAEENKKREIHSQTRCSPDGNCAIFSFQCYKIDCQLAQRNLQLSIEFSRASCFYQVRVFILLSKNEVILLSFKENSKKLSSRLQTGNWAQIFNSSPEEARQYLYIAA